MNTSLEFHVADCLEWMRGQPADRFDLVFGSPPYETQRTYGLPRLPDGQAWVDWMVSVVWESLRICRGMVAFVVEGRTKNYRWSGVPALLQADLLRAGVCLRKPPIFKRHGIPGSSGPDFWRNDYETILCCTRGGRLPYAHPLEIGKPCKYRTGGAFSYRTKDGQRINEAKHKRGSAVDLVKQGRREGRPETTNPGNVIAGLVGGGHMGSDLAYENEAPFPNWLVEPFVRCFVPLGGWVLDPFLGSGTTMDVAQRWGRNCVGVDIRESQVELAKRRCAQKMLL